MITEKDLQEAIAECQGTRNPNANTCIKLAAYYIILDHLCSEQEAEVKAKNDTHLYSYAHAPTESAVSYLGESDFAKKIYGLDNSKVYEVMDELMSTLQVLHPSLYNGVMRKLSNI